MTYKPGSGIHDEFLLGTIISELHETLCSSLNFELHPILAIFRQGYGADLVVVACKCRYSYDKWDSTIVVVGNRLRF